MLQAPSGYLEEETAGNYDQSTHAKDGCPPGIFEGWDLKEWTHYQEYHKDPHRLTYSSCWKELQRDIHKTEIFR